MSLSNTIKAIQNIMRKDAGVDGDAQRIGQLGWMLFLKIYSDLELETELEDTSYESPIPSAFRWESWADETSAGKDSRTGDSLINFVNNELFPQLKELDLTRFSGQARERGALLISVFDDAYNYMKNGTLLRQVINKINQDIDYNSVETRHLFGDIYEQILRDLQNAGNAGEYYTPRAVTQFAIEMVNPQLGEVVLDPACGTGGFLTGAFEHMKKQVKNPSELRALKNSIRGVEKKPLPHVLCATNMMVHGIEVPSNIINDNTLAKPLRDYGKSDQVDVIITNPPFGGVEEDGIENNFPTEFRTRETADLFLVLVMELLKDGGRAAIVLPDSTLFGEGVKIKIKKKMLEECNLHTIVRLPKSVFAPYTGISTNVLFLTKGEPTKDVWYFEHRLPEGVKAYNKTNPIRLEEFDVEKKWWTNRQQSGQAWKVSVADIAEKNYNLDIKNPNATVEVHDDSDELLKQFKELSKNVTSLQAELKKLLAESLDTARTKEELQSALIRIQDNWEMLAGTTESIESLRMLVLDLAIRGNLTPLTSQIISPVTKTQNGPFSIPANWKWCALQEITEDLGQETPDSDFSYIDVASIDNKTGTISKDLTVLSARNAPSRARKRVAQGSVLFSTVRPYLRNIAIVDREFTPRAIASTAFAVLHPIKSVSPVFLFFCLRSNFFKSFVESKQKGVAYPAINGADLKSALFPIPPLAEQEQIIRVVTALLNLCDQLEGELSQRSSLAGKFAKSITAIHS